MLTELLLESLSGLLDFLFDYILHLLGIEGGLVVHQHGSGISGFIGDDFIGNFPELEESAVLVVLYQEGLVGEVDGTLQELQELG